MVRGVNCQLLKYTSTNRYTKAVSALQGFVFFNWAVQEDDECTKRNNLMKMNRPAKSMSRAMVVAVSVSAPASLNSSKKGPADVCFFIRTKVTISNC